MGDSMPAGSSPPLPASALRQHCDPAMLGFTTTAELEPLYELVGQERALSAISFGARNLQDGFNIFAMGPAHSGRHKAIKRFLESKAAEEALPDDWVYVNNFEAPDKPVAIRLPSGKGVGLKAAMAELVDDLSSAIPAMFESEDYRNRRKGIDDEFETAQQNGFESLRKKAQAENIAILRTPMGFALAPLVNGQVIKPDVFNALPAAERQRSKVSSRAFSRNSKRRCATFLRSRRNGAQDPRAEQRAGARRGLSIRMLWFSSRIMRR